MGLIESALTASASGSPLAVVAAFGAGAATGYGPCAATRLGMLAEAIKGGGTGVILLRCGAFVAGMCLALVAIGTVAGAVSWLAGVTQLTYVGLAAVCCALGVKTLCARAAHGCRREKRRSSVSGCFVGGACSMLVLSPCCGPVAPILGAMMAAGGNSVLAGIVLLAFGLGHAVPVLLGALAYERLNRWVEQSVWDAALRTIEGSVLIAMGGYYGLLA